MELTVSEAAANWYESELEIEGESSLRFYVRYGGVGGKIPGFSLAIKIEEPSDPIAETKVGKVRYYVEAADEWYFDQSPLHVTLNEKWSEPDYHYENIKEED